MLILVHTRGGGGGDSTSVERVFFNPVSDFEKKCLKALI
jgi:hypothetical protein